MRRATVGWLFTMSTARQRYTASYVRAQEIHSSRTASKKRNTGTLVLGASWALAHVLSRRALCNHSEPPQSTRPARAGCRPGLPPAGPDPRSEPTPSDGRRRARARARASESSPALASRRPGPTRMANLEMGPRRPDSDNRSRIPSAGSGPPRANRDPPARQFEPSDGPSRAQHCQPAAWNRGPAPAGPALGRPPDPPGSAHPTRISPPADDRQRRAVVRCRRPAAARLRRGASGVERAVRRAQVGVAALLAGDWDRLGPMLAVLGEFSSSRAVEAQRLPMI
jgi:hypothetical protein